MQRWQSFVVVLVRSQDDKSRSTTSLLGSPPLFLSTPSLQNHHHTQHETITTTTTTTTTTSTHATSNLRGTPSLSMATATMSLDVQSLSPPWNGSGQSLPAEGDDDGSNLNEENGARGGLSIEDEDGDDDGNGDDDDEEEDDRSSSADKKDDEKSDFDRPDRQQKAASAIAEFMKNEAPKELAEHKLAME